MAKESPTTKPQERVYVGSQEIDHDLFRLLPASMVRNVGYDALKPIIEHINHSHIYHTVDSSGKKLTDCSYVGGHHHEMTIEASGDGVPKVICSAPKKFVMRNINGAQARVSTSVIVGSQEDTHTHVIEYWRSEKINIRQYNPEFLKYQAIVKAQEPARVPNVSG